MSADELLYCRGNSRAHELGNSRRAAAVRSHLVSRYISWSAERRFPPIGKFIEVDGVRLHYVEKGSGPALVLLHGQGALLQDFTQTILEPLAKIIE